MMARAKQSEGKPRLPKLCIEPQELEEEGQTEEDLATPRAQTSTDGLRFLCGDLPTRTRPEQIQHRSASEVELSGATIDTSDTMPSKPSSKHHSEPSGGHSSKKHGTSKSRSKSTKSDDWTEVTEPDERRRIQNRIAQRKFREKARENKERDERVANNLENAENSYRITKPEDLPEEPEDQPWGTLSWKAILARGHEAESCRSSGKGGEYLGDDPRTLSPGGYAAYPVSRQAPSHGSSGGNDDPSLYDGPSPFFYDYEYNQAGGPSQATGEEMNGIPFGYQNWLQPEPQLPADPFGPYDTASPSSSSSISSGGFHGVHRRTF